MLIDINSFVGHWPFKRLHSNNCDGLLERMNEYGVDLSIVTNLHGVFYKNTQSANEEQEPFPAFRHHQPHLCWLEG
jgi:hypothetical protein